MSFLRALVDLAGYKRWITLLAAAVVLKYKHCADRSLFSVISL